MKNSNNNKYNFFLNTHTDAAFTRCPKCDNATKIKKLPLTIVMEKNKSILNLNKTCKYCPFCELIIAKKYELDQIIGQFLGIDKVTDKDYFVLGTQEKSAYLAGLNKGFIKEKPLEGVSVFKNVWHFELQRPYWDFKK